MKELKCPKCGSVFSVDEADYASIAGQVRNKEFEKELDRRMEELQKRRKAEQEADTLRNRERFLKELGDKEAELQNRDTEIVRLREMIKGFEQGKELALAEERRTRELALAEERRAREEEVAKLKARLSESDNRMRIAVLEEQKRAEEVVRKGVDALNKANARLELVESKAELEKQSLRDDLNDQMRRLREERDYYKDMKARMSTKMIGESLEVHCSTEFNRVRTRMFPYAFFEKDNDASSGTKGDFIFRDFVDGMEYVSIMFEMKNEADTTATKHKNEDFFAKLDKDRREKNCEYAVLVSLLEPDSEFYNDGIVDVSYRYEKMFVVRPQFFMAVISLLTKASLKSVDYKRQLELARQQTVDVTNFENKVNAFRTNFQRHYENAGKKFSAAVEEIDKTIKSLQKMKENLLSSENYMRLANQDTDDLSIKRLTRGNPTMKAAFDEARREASGESVV